MASQIQITRGSLHAKGLENLLRGELFWVPSNTSNESENKYRENPSFPYDRGTLYIGRPGVDNGTSGNGTTTYAIPIAGERAYKGMVFRGYITNETEKTDLLFKYVREGDFFIFDNDAVGGTFKNEDHFLKGDILLITQAIYTMAPEPGSEDVGESRDVQYLKINASSGFAHNIVFSGEDINATNVEDAINEVNAKKLQYKGNIPVDFSYAELMTYQEDDLSRLELGSLYFISEDGLSFTGKNVNGVENTWISQKGDFVIWQNDQDKWLLIPSGYTDASEIDFDPSLAVVQQEQLGTFGEDDREHINSTQALRNVQDAITYLLSHKAMLDSNGKVPLSQLHDTVLGAMQYCGTWNPINDAQGVNDPAFQNPWPTGTGRGAADSVGDEESPGQGSSAIRNNKNGDYYIVKVLDGIKNVQYYDKDSLPTGDYFERCEELNSGDWIVYQVDPVTKVASWQVIDNSDSITSINFIINGTEESGEAEKSETEDFVSIVGNPELSAKNKIVLLKNDNKITIAGVRLVDQDKNDPYRGAASDRYLPVYTGSNDTIKRSSVENYRSNAFNGAYVTETHSNLIIGSDDVQFNEYIYGDIYIRPKLEVIDSTNVQTNSAIRFEVVTEQGSTVFNSSKLMADPNQYNGTQIVLPDETSKIIGKLAGCQLIKNRLTKVSNRDNNTGYIDNTSIEEHMRETTADHYMDTDVISIEFHSPVVDINNIETRHITIGQATYLNADASNGGEFDENGRLLIDEKKSNIYSHPYQNESGIDVHLPQHSGILLTDSDWRGDINGTTGTLPIYGQDDQRDGESEPRNTLIDSKITQVSNSLFGVLFNTASNMSDTRTLGEGAHVNNYEIEDYRDVDFASKMYGGEEIDGAYYGTPDNVNINTDTVIGETMNTGAGFKITTPHSLMVTKSFILGNDKTNMTHFIPGRTLFPGSEQYRDAHTEMVKPIKEVYVEPPSESGVLLSNNSRIDGGFYID